MSISKMTVAKISILMTLLGGAISHHWTKKERASFDELTPKTKKVIMQEQTAMQELLGTIKKQLLQGEYKKLDKSMQHLEIYVNGLKKFPGYQDLSSEIKTLREVFSAMGEINMGLDRKILAYKNFLKNKKMLNEKYSHREIAQSSPSLRFLNLKYDIVYRFRTGDERIDFALKEAIKYFSEDTIKRINALLEEYQEAYANPKIGINEEENVKSSIETLQIIRSEIASAGIR